MCASPQDWSALSENVQWAIICDLSNDHQDGIAAAANLLGLTMTEVISFVNLYLREKALWENGASQDETPHPPGALQSVGKQDEVVHLVPEAEAGHTMQDFEPGRRHIEAGANEMTFDVGFDLQSLGGVADIWHEPETELFLEADNQVAAEERVGQLGAEKGADQPGVLADEEQAPLVELVTDSFSREDIASGRSFLTFVGLQEHADRFGEWFGRGTSFREIPGIFDENNEFIFSTEDTEKALYKGNELDWEVPVPRPMKDPAQREWLKGALPHHPARHKQPVNPPLQQTQALRQFDNGIARRFLEPGHVHIDEGFNRRKRITPSHPLPFAQLPPLLRPHEGIVQAAGKAVPAFASLGHSSSQITGSDQTSQAQSRDASIAAPNTTKSQSVEMPSDQDAGGMAENDMRDARVSVGPASGEAVASAAQSDAQGAADSGRFSENGIAIEGFPKCASCFTARARCNGDRPCSNCVTRNRKCKEVTKADLDKFPDRAVRVIRDKAKADEKVTQDAEETMAQATAVPAPVSTTTAVGVKRKHSAIARDASPGEDDSDLDRFPPEREDPKDSDYDTTPKKKRPKKGNAPASKKQPTSKGGPATSTPTKRGPRGPYKKKAEKSAPKSNEPVAGATSTPSPQPGGSAVASSAVAVTSAQKDPAKAPAAEMDKSSGFCRNAGEDRRLGAAAGIPVHNTAEAVRHAGDRFGMTNVRPVPVGERGEPHSVFDPSSFSPYLSGAGDARYLDIPFAPIGSQTRSPTRRVALRTPMTPISMPIAGFRASPSQGAYPMPGAPGHLIPHHPQTTSAENDQLSGAELTSTSSTLNARMAAHEKLPVATERMSQAPRIAQPGVTEISPTSQSSGSGTTVSMDFLRMPYSPAQDSPAYSHESMSDRLPQSRLDYRSMSGYSPGFSAGKVSLGSPTALQRPRSVSSHNNGAHSSATGVPSPMMAANPGFVLGHGLMSPYAMFAQQRSIHRPVSKMQEGPGYPVPQQSVHPSSPSGVFRDHQSDEIRSGLRVLGGSPSHQQHTHSLLPAKRVADASLNFGQRPARKKPRSSDSPLAPPREARSWKELARTQWASETQENQPETSKSSVKPVFGGDGSYEVSFTQFTRVREQIDPELQQTAIAGARKINHSPADTSEKR
ncbi:hypothetical protein F5883DRAFT_101390 [Diaporthe sp. PMI_573]|nr:hypothetical protein F5883DRAFT_101390 [Diaporthaceae sp. PMI_573]